MGRPLTEILWQLERKRKYRWSCGTNRTSSIAKAVTLVLLLCLVYLSICSVLDAGIKLDFMDKTGLTPPEYHRSAASDHNDHKNFRDISISDTHTRNMFNEVEVGSGSLAISLVTKLAQFFYKADKDGNKYLDMSELSKWINDRVIAHFSRAVKDNFDHHFQIDTNPQNGLVSWEEYMSFFFKTRAISGVTADDIRNRSPPFEALSRDIKVEIARIQASWSEAASNNPDFLTVDEFLAFEHPEASPTKIISQVQDTFATFDLDGDGIITQNEMDTTYREAEGVDLVYRNDKQLIDSDGNGQISRVELMRYMDPRSIHHSEKEAKELMGNADKDKDGRLSLLEVVESANVVVKSKFYDAARNMHVNN